MVEFVLGPTTLILAADEHVNVPVIDVVPEDKVPELLIDVDDKDPIVAADVLENVPELLIDVVDKLPIVAADVLEKVPLFRSEVVVKLPIVAEDVEDNVPVLVIEVQLIAPVVKLLVPLLIVAQVRFPVGMNNPVEFSKGSDDTSHPTNTPAVLLAKEVEAG